MKLNRYLLISAISAAIFTVPVAYAKIPTKPPLVTADQSIKNLTSTLGYLKKNSQMTVFFPNKVPRSKTTLFASYSSFDSKPDYNKFWIITVANTPACTMKGCTVGELSAEKNKSIEPTYTQAPYDANNKPLPKEKITLANNITAYFTPGHAEADWHPASIEWVVNNVLYTLSWDLDKKSLTKIANSAISQ